MEGLIRINFNLQESPAVGRKIYVARPENYSTIGLDAIVAYAAKAAGITQSDMYVTLDALYDAFQYFICNGHSFKLDGVGTFSLSVRTKSGLASDEEVLVGADAVDSVGINFLPSVELKKLLEDLSISLATRNENNLTEDATIFARSLKIGAWSLNAITFDNTRAANAKVGEKFVISGYNLEKGMVAEITGNDGATAVSETIPLKLLSEKTQIEAEGVFTKKYTIVTKVVIKKDSNVLFTFDWSGAPIPPEKPTTGGGSGSGQPSNPGGETSVKKTITVLASPSNGGNVTGGGQYTVGQQVTLTASPAYGYTFSKWDDNNTSATRQITVSEDKSYRAIFIQNTDDEDEGH